MNGATIAFQAGAFLLAPLLLGIINKTKAWFGGRTGAPVLQPYFELWKLLQKSAVYSRTTTGVFRAGPIVALAAVSVAVLLLPVGQAGSAISFAGDLALFAGLLTLARFSLVAAALDTGSAFEGIGASREAAFSALGELALFLGLATLVIVSGSVSLSGVLHGGVSGPWLSATGPALALAAGALFLLLLAENARLPVDDPNTHLELTMIHEVMVLDHSGPDFAYILYAAALKLWIFGTLAVGLVLPFSTGNVWADGAVYLAGMLAVAVAVGVVESSMARLRMPQVPYLILGAGALAGLGVTLALAAR